MEKLDFPQEKRYNRKLTKLNQPVDSFQRTTPISSKKLIFTLLLAVLTSGNRADCGFIKLRDSMKEYDGENAQLIRGSFDGYVKSEYSVFGFFRILGKEIKTYNLFKFDNNPSDSSGIRDAEIPGIYSELLTVSFTRYSTENLLLCKNLPEHLKYDEFNCGKSS